MGNERKAYLYRGLVLAEEEKILAFIRKYADRFSRHAEILNRVREIEDSDDGASFNDMVRLAEFLDEQSFQIGSLHYHVVSGLCTSERLIGGNFEGFVLGIGVKKGPFSDDTYECWVRSQTHTSAFDKFMRYDAKVEPEDFMDIHAYD